MSYATYDFTESLKSAHVDPQTVERVIAAWGKGDGQGDDAGHYKWAEDGVTDWAGGFLMQLRDGRFAYLTGWCDYTGWGCQDGAEVTHFDAEPSLETLTNHNGDEDYSRYGHEPAPDEWDREPADLNKWLADGAKDTDAL